MTIAMEMLTDFTKQWTIQLHSILSYAYLSAKYFHNSTSILDDWYMLKHHREHIKASLLFKHQLMIYKEIFKIKVAGWNILLIAILKFTQKVTVHSRISINY